MRCRFIICLLLLSGCAHPTTNYPTANASELSEERNHESALITGHALELMRKQQMERLKMEERLVNVSSKIAGAAADVCLDLQKSSKSNQCVYIYQLDKPETPMNAYADGKQIVIAPAMMRFTKEDEELAFILSHETAHNIMGHIAAKTGNAIIGAVMGAMLDGVAAYNHVNSQGEFSKTGAQLADLTYSAAFEAEADYVGMYILARAGYRIEDVPEFWRRLAVKKPDVAYIGTTHPTTPARFVAMRKTIREIQWKKKHHLPLLPELKPVAVSAIPAETNAYLREKHG